MKFVVFAYLLVILHTGSGGASPQALSYPDELLVKFGIDVEEIMKNREKFRADPTHAEWMGHVRSTISGIDPAKEETMVKTHTSLLYIKMRMDQAYFGGVMDKQEFTARLAELMQWFQQANRSVLNEIEYNDLFGISGQDEVSATGRVPEGEIGFPVHNPKTTARIIKERFNDRTIADITRFYQQRSQELKDITEIYESRDFGGATEWQVRKDMIRIENELDAAFISYCRDRLTDDEFQLLFGDLRK